ncbi:MAG TPA: CorA family divalent cation transporter, partial [Candidatus Paceibacterota bacterium]|nr:CorA family divalent cation transporter [Candidatus Paceibacterota bacterium]
MIKQLKYKNVTWIDIIKPTREEVENLAKKYKLHDVAVEEILNSSTRSKVDWYENNIYLALHFPVNKYDIAEIDFILGQDFIITTHTETIQPLAEFAQILDGGTDNKKDKDFHAGHLFYYMMRELYDPLEIELDNINNKLKKIETKIFAGQEAEMIRSLSHANQQLLDIKWSLKFHREVLNSLASVAKDFYGNKFEHYLRSIISEYEHIDELVKSNREIFVELHNTNESLITIKNGITMRVLTTLAFIFLPVTLIAFIFSMSGSGPIVEKYLGWHGVILLQIIVALTATGIA